MTLRRAREPLCIFKKVDVLISIAEHAEIPNDIRQACIALLIERAAVFA